jgi:RNA-binding protein
MDRRMIHELKPTVWIGKRGVTPEAVEEVARQLEERRVVKIRWLQSADVDPGDLAARTGSEVVDVRGRTVVLAARRERSGKPPRNI